MCWRGVIDVRACSVIAYIYIAETIGLNPISMIRICRNLGLAHYRTCWRDADTRVEVIQIPHDIIVTRLKNMECKKLNSHTKTMTNIAIKTGPRRSYTCIATPSVQIGVDESAPVI